MLVVDPRGTSTTGLPYMEIHVYLGREEPRDNLAGTSRRIQRRLTMVEPYEKFYMEHSEGSGNKPPPHASRIEIINETGIFCILEFKRMSDITDQYLIRVRSRAENQYESLRRSLEETIRRQG